MKTILIVITALLAFLIPLALVIMWSRKNKCSSKPYVVGALCFIIFATIIEGIFNSYILAVNETTSKYLYNNPLAYGMFGALVAGIFEETGRLFGFKVLLKKNKNKETSVAYGIGHGSIECILSLGTTYLMFALVSLGLNLGSDLANEQILQAIEVLDVSVIPLAIIERLAAISLHIGLSIIMFKAANKKGYLWLYPVSILIHFIADLPAGFYQAGLITNIPLVELFIVVISIATLMIGIKMYKNMKNEGETTNA